MRKDESPLLLVVIHHESVHPEDLQRAIVTRLLKGQSIQSAADAMVLDGLATAVREGREFDHDQREWIARRADPKILQRIAKATRSTSKRYTFSPVQRFLLSTWRAIEINGRTFPGLRPWKSSAALTLLQCAGLMTEETQEENYNSLVSDLGFLRKGVLVSTLKQDCKGRSVIKGDGIEK